MHFEIERQTVNFDGIKRHCGGASRQLVFYTVLKDGIPQKDFKRMRFAENYIARFDAARAKELRTLRQAEEDAAKRKFFERWRTSLNPLPVCRKLLKHGKTDVVDLERMALEVFHAWEAFPKDRPKTDSLLGEMLNEGAFIASPIAIYWRRG